MLDLAANSRQCLRGQQQGKIAYKILNLEVYKDLQRFIRDLQNHKDLQICEDL